MSSRRTQRRTMLGNHRNKVYAVDHGVGFLGRLYRPPRGTSSRTLYRQTRYSPVRARDQPGHGRKSKDVK